MTLLGILTDMNVAEICGLQWKHINLTAASVIADGEPIPPISIAVRKQCYRGEFGNVRKNRLRNFAIPEVMIPMLLRLRVRSGFSGPDDFAVVSRTGAPINAINIGSRRLRSIGRQLQIPWLSWHAIRQAHSALKSEFGTQVQYHMAMAIDSDTRQGVGTGKKQGVPERRAMAAHDELRKLQLNHGESLKDIAPQSLISVQREIRAGRLP
jgi:integrase